MKLLWRCNGIELGWTWYEPGNDLVWICKGFGFWNETEVIWDRVSKNVEVTIWQRSKKEMKLNKRKSDQSFS